MHDSGFISQTIQPKRRCNAHADVPDALFVRCLFLIYILIVSDRL